MQGIPSAANPENRMADGLSSPPRSNEAEAAEPADEAADGGAARANLGADGPAAAAGADLDTGAAAAPVPAAPGSPDPGGSPPPASSDTHLLAPQQRISSRPVMGSQRMQQPAPADPEQARQDAELEVSLSVLTHLRFDMHVWTCQPTFSVTFGGTAALLHRVLLVQVYTHIAKP